MYTPESSPNSSPASSPTPNSFYSTSPTYTPGLWYPPARRNSGMSFSGPSNPYAAMEIPNVDLVRKESQDLHELQKRNVELVSNSMIGAALDLHVREADKAAAARIREAASIGGGSGPK
ncbi:uncharacterized protein JCM15063_000714 [Sporobolomyces koalae]|uniref:uncharacterized protein n=1 Tax=Sporobolomyces koalae TaxID=500713 RepID=UPI00317C2671